jgi:hypothetical protein
MSSTCAESFDVETSPIEVNNQCGETVICVFSFQPFTTSEIFGSEKVRCNFATMLNNWKNDTDLVAYDNDNTFYLTYYKQSTIERYHLYEGNVSSQYDNINDGRYEYTYSSMKAMNFKVTYTGVANH